MSKALIVLSGGQDSTTCLYLAKEHGYDEIHAITFNYGQRHSRELWAAKTIGQMAGVTSHELIDLGPGILESTSPLVSDNELEQYDDHKSLPGGIEKTFVPMRNQLFLTIAANRAIARGCKHIYTGVCQEDSGGYPDCRQMFISAFEVATNQGTFDSPDPRALSIRTPLMHLTKAEAVAMAVKMAGCYSALAYSHTAYDGQYPPRGKDHATLLRAKGFEEANIPDPLLLRAVYGDEVMEVDELPNTENYTEAKVEQFWQLFVEDLENNNAVSID